jgi:hypothetical protein
MFLDLEAEVDVGDEEAEEEEYDNGTHIPAVRI